MFTRRIYWIISLAAVMLLLAGCNLPGQQATPTTDPGLIYTQAAQSVAATLTQAAVGTPVSASTPTGAPVIPSATLPPTNTRYPHPDAAAQRHTGAAHRHRCSHPLRPGRFCG